MEERENVVDLDKYRNQRIEQGTWPLTDAEYREYWRKVKESNDSKKKALPEYKTSLDLSHDKAQALKERIDLLFDRLDEEKRRRVDAEIELTDLHYQMQRPEDPKPTA